MAVRTLTVPHDAPARLDAFLSRALPGFSKSELQRLLAQGLVRVNGKKAKPLRRIMGGEVVELEVAEPAKPASPPTQRRLVILRETDTLAVFNKPPDLVVAAEKGQDSVELIAASQLSKLSVGGRHQVGLVQRLDKDTTGCLMVAKTDEALVELQRAFDEKRVTKTYLALVLGAPPDTASLDQPYGRHPEDPRRYTTRFPSPRRARLSWKKLDQLGDLALLEIALDTGRTHQIRAQLADAGHPLPGDWLYGTTEARAMKRRIPLHAWKLAVDDPRHGFAVEAPIPADFDLPARLVGA